MKFFHALIILATSGGVATAKDSSRASASDRNRKQERDRKRFLRIKQSARRSLGSMPSCVKGTGDCCINTIVGGGKSSKTGRIIQGDGAFPGLGCAKVCVPLCAVENAPVNPNVFPPPPATCVVPQASSDNVPIWANNGVCP